MDDPSRPDEERGRSIPTAGRYSVEALLAVGGMGEIYRGRDPLLDREVALKRLRPFIAREPDARERILSEARAAADLRHPAIVRVLDVVEEEGELWVVQELAEGESLRRRMADPWPLDSFCRFAAACLDALAAVSDAGVVHGDLKPENIVVGPDGLPRILDFGIARRITPPVAGGDHDATAPLREAVPSGTIDYMAPERLRGEPSTIASDLFSLGVVFYEMLTGAHPYRRETPLETAAAILGAPAPSLREHNPVIPERVDSFVRRMLDPDPARRPASAREAMTELRATTDECVETIDRYRPAPGRGVRLWLLGALALVAVVLVIGRIRDCSTSTVSSALELQRQAESYLATAEDPTRLEVSADLFARALGRDSTLVEAQAGLAESYRLLWKETREPQWLGRAEAVALAASRGGGENPRLLEVLGRIHLDSGRDAQAERAFRQALELDPESAGALVGLALIQDDAGETALAESTFVRAVRVDPDAWRVQSEFGGFYAKHGEFAKARDRFQEALRVVPGHARMHSNLGAVQLRLGEMDAAIASFQRSIAIRPNHRAYNNLAFAYRSKGRLPEAAEVLEKSLVLNDGDFRVWTSLAGTLAGIPGREADADSVARRAIALGEAQLAVNQKDPQLLAVLAELYLQIKEPYRGGILVDRALESGKDQVEVLVPAAAALDRLGRRDEAVDLLVRALGLGLSMEAIREEPALKAFHDHPRLIAIEAGTAPSEAGPAGK